MKDHYVYIAIQSEGGKGSTFTIYFPVTRDETGKVGKAISTVFYTSKGEPMLVVDDVKEQRELAMSMLGGVDAVASGEEE